MEKFCKILKCIFKYVEIKIFWSLKHMFYLKQKPSLIIIVLKDSKSEINLKKIKQNQWETV